jgi:hypothetical protein
MKYYSLLSVMLLIAFANSSISKKSTIEIIHYAIINQGEVQVKTIGVKDLKLNKESNWAARALFDGENYNKTG